MSIQSLLIFLGASLIVTLAPGPDIITVVTRSVSQGIAAGLVATLGFASGLIFHTTVAAIGLSLVIRKSPAAFQTIKILGAAYLLYLAIRLFLSKDEVALERRPDERRALGRIYVQSVLMNVLNPKVWFFFVVLLSASVSPQSSIPVRWQLMILGALFAACTLVCFGSCAILAGSLTAFIRERPRAARPLRWATCAVFIILAIQLLLLSPGSPAPPPS
jgi:threonine/homoserine/homoserine lactone efflux protein